MKLFGRETFDKHERQWDHGEKYGRAISIRGERHCGTGWVRVMTNDNCKERHLWTPKLDSDGIYKWKHGFVPSSFDPRSKDAIVVIFRSAIPWVPKMQRAPYSQAIQRVSVGSLAHFVSRSFSEYNHHFTNVLDLRTQKYSQYLDFQTSHPNCLGVRYEDLLSDPTFLFYHLSQLGFKCIHDPATFHYVTGYAKFGAVSPSGATSINLPLPSRRRRPPPDGPSSSSQLPHPTPNRSWSLGDWTAVVDRLDITVEDRIGYGYDRDLPGRWYLRTIPDDSPLLRPRERPRSKRRRRRR